MSTIDPRHAAMLKTAPVVAIPRFGELESLTLGHRYLVGARGLYLEVARPWLRFCEPIAEIDEHELRTPYGDTDYDTMITIPYEQLAVACEEFLEYARAHKEVEVAALGVWHPCRDALEVWPVDAREQSATRIAYNRPRLGRHQHLVLDMHSHGTLPAGFSVMDDLDDAGEVKISVVYGSLDEPEPTLAMRLCVHGFFVDLGDLLTDLRDWCDR